MALGSESPIPAKESWKEKVVFQSQWLVQLYRHTHTHSAWHTHTCTCVYVAELHACTCTWRLRHQHCTPLLNLNIYQHRHCRYVDCMHMYVEKVSFPLHSFSLSHSYMYIHTVLGRRMTITTCRPE